MDGSGKPAPISEPEPSFRDHAVIYGTLIPARSTPQPFSVSITSR